MVGRFLRAGAIWLLLSVGFLHELHATEPGNVIANVVEPPVPPFSSLKPGDGLPSVFRVITLPRIPANAFALVADEGKMVLRVTSQQSAGSMGLPLIADPQRTPRLTWRWKVSRVLEKADFTQKSGDDHAARVDVFFDVPLSALSFAERTQIRLARMMSGMEVPTASLVYVWDNKHPIGEGVPSPYTSRSQKIVLRTGGTQVGHWQIESRDVAADFRRMFGHEAPRITSVALGSDTDNTGESAVTWFGDIAFAPASR